VRLGGVCPLGGAAQPALRTEGPACHTARIARRSRHDVSTAQLARSVFQSIMGSYEGAFSAEPAAGDQPSTGGLGRPGEPVVGSPTHDPPGHRSCQTRLCSGK
jgi:hypothetical protein